MTLYETLEVARDATVDEITEAYRRLAAACHPAVDDSPDAEARFHELTAAFRVLSDPTKRRDYDTFLIVEGADPETFAAAPAPSSAVDDWLPMPPTGQPASVPVVAPPVAGRARRKAVSRRNRATALWAAAGIVVVGAVVWAVAAAGGGSTGSPAASPSPIGGRSELTVFALGGDHPTAAVVGTGGGRPPVVAWIPSNLLTPTGSGGGSIAQAFDESAAVGRTVVSNVTGTWIPHYVRLEPDQLAAIVSQRGGLQLDLPSALKLGKKMVGPGTTRLAGPQVVAYLEADSGSEQDLRWAEVLKALFAQPFPLPDDAESNDLAAAAAAVAAAKGAEVAELPTAAGEGPYRRADPELMRRGMADLFGIQGEDRVEVIVFRGVDRPGISEAATETLVPKGFHIAAYQDVRGLDKGRVRDTTTISYYGDDLRAEAERIQQALGVGEVVLSDIGSGVGNISVMLGKDYASSLGG